MFKGLPIQLSKHLYSPVHEQQVGITLHFRKQELYAVNLQILSSNNPNNLDLHS